ncbi:MAG: polysaccharide lyase [Gaiellaceae bacterium]
MEHRAPQPARLRLLALAACVLVGLISTSTALASTCVGNYETGSFRGWRSVQAMPGDAAVVKSPVRDGQYAGRFAVDQGSTPIKSLTSNRSEVAMMTQESAGDESWWAWSTYFPADFTPNRNTAWNVFTQWPHYPSLYVAPISFYVNTIPDPAAIELHAWGGEGSLKPPHRRYFRLAEFEREKWYDFVFHVRWGDSPSTGFVEVWVNGQQVVPLTPAATLYSGNPVYLKQGFYRNASENKAVVYHDALRRGVSYSDLARPCSELSAADEDGPGASLQFVSRPRSLPDRRLQVKGLALAGKRVEMTVRGPRGSLLARSITRAGDKGGLEKLLRLKPWRRQAWLRVGLRMRYNGETVRVTRRVWLTTDERSVLSTR